MNHFGFQDLNLNDANWQDTGRIQAQKTSDGTFNLSQVRCMDTARTDVHVGHEKVKAKAQNCFRLKGKRASA